MKLSGANFGWMFLLLFALLVIGTSGCATNEPDNASVRPWNSPRGWENGIPSSMTEGR